mmetsp:Transcript_24186/g.26865  ORF Transcript_24186/g.26865 Transcript_24186/m.26865 type:complete len:94 (-) Transcript_24186:234-515(-)
MKTIPTVGSPEEGSVVCLPPTASVGEAGVKEVVGVFVIDGTKAGVKGKGDSIGGLGRLGIGPKSAGGRSLSHNKAYEHVLDETHVVDHPSTLS